MADATHVQLENFLWLRYNTHRFAHRTRDMPNFIKVILKFLFVDSTVNILGDLFEQPLIMWAMIGWGWLAMLVMLSSIVYQMSNL